MSRFSIASWFRFSQRFWQVGLLAILMGLGLFGQPAFAHHPMGGREITTAFEGFMSGLGHPIIEYEHFAFVVAVGLLSSIKRQGFLIPVAFVLATLGGTGLHLAGVMLPGVALFVAGSILLFGLLLSLRNNLNNPMVIGLAIIAGLYHGHAYGESILGAEMSPLLAYLSGFTVIQLVIASCAFGAGRAVLKSSEQQVSPALRSAGWVICGIGLTLLTSQLVKAVFPVV